MQLRLPAGEPFARRRKRRTRPLQLFVAFRELSLERGEKLQGMGKTPGDPLKRCLSWGKQPLGAGEPFA